MNNPIDRVIFETKALEFPYAQELRERFSRFGIPMEEKKRFTRPAGTSEGGCTRADYVKGKRTLIVGVRNISRFETCKPSADYQLPVVSGCPGMCEYCYLMTRMSTNPVIKINVNLDPVFHLIQKYIESNEYAKITKFELSATSEPVALEPLTGIVSKFVNYFANQINCRLRVCTKFVDIQNLIDLNHNRHTEIRFTMNTNDVIRKFEHATPSLNQRLAAAKQIFDAGYPTGIMIGPVFFYEGWQNDYEALLHQIKQTLENRTVTFEVVTHRFTKRAKESILQIYPDTELDLNEEKRKFKFGQFGYGKYIYAPNDLDQIRMFFKERISELFPGSSLLYVV